MNGVRDEGIPVRRCHIVSKILYYVDEERRPTHVIMSLGKKKW